MRINSKMSNKGIFEYFESSTNITIPAIITTTSIPTTTTTTTSKPIIPIINIDESENIIDGIETINGFLLIIVIQLTIIIAYKMFKMCRRVYTFHNEKIVRIHERTNPQL